MSEMDFNHMVWEMYATSPNGEKIYCGNADYAHAADLLLTSLEERGFTDTSKTQVLRENAGYSSLRRAQ